MTNANRFDDDGRELGSHHGFAPPKPVGWRLSLIAEVVMTITLVIGIAAAMTALTVGAAPGSVIG